MDRAVVALNVVAYAKQVKRVIRSTGSTLLLRTEIGRYRVIFGVPVGVTVVGVVLHFTFRLRVIGRVDRTRTRSSREYNERKRTKEKEKRDFNL